MASLEGASWDECLSRSAQAGLGVYSRVWEGYDIPGVVAHSSLDSRLISSRSFTASGPSHSANSSTVIARLVCRGWVS
jgi:hypothetical protein